MKTVEDNPRIIDGVAKFWLGHSLASLQQDFGSKRINTTSSYRLTREQLIERKAIQKVKKKY